MNVCTGMYKQSFYTKYTVTLRPQVHCYRICPAFINATAAKNSLPLKTRKHLFNPVNTGFIDSNSILCSSLKL